MRRLFTNNQHVFHKFSTKKTFFNSFATYLYPFFPTLATENILKNGHYINHEKSDQDFEGSKKYDPK